MFGVLFYFLLRPEPRDVTRNSRNAVLAMTRWAYAGVRVCAIRRRVFWTPSGTAFYFVFIFFLRSLRYRAWLFFFIYFIVRSYWRRAAPFWGFSWRLPSRRCNAAFTGWTVDFCGESFDSTPEEIWNETASFCGIFLCGFWGSRHFNWISWFHETLNLVEWN